MSKWRWKKFNNVIKLRYGRFFSKRYSFKTKSTDEIEKELLEFSKERKMELILPCLYSELEGEALPKIVSEISKTKYLNHIISQETLMKI